MARHCVSIILCTRDHAAALAQTLHAIERNCRHDSYSIELIVVDNASSDETATVVNGFDSPWLNVKYIYEPRKGKAVCLNRALSEARGEIILLTDDDVRPQPKWIPTMCVPIVEGRADVVAGGLEMAPHLCRNWMEGFHRTFLASTDAVDPNTMDTVIGANCAFSRSVLDKVPSLIPSSGLEPWVTAKTLCSLVR